MDDLKSVGTVDMRPEITVADGDLTEKVRTLLFHIDFFALMVRCRGLSSEEAQKSFQNLRKDGWALTTTPIE